jgi:hypothetical protein
MGQGRFPVIPELIRRLSFVGGGSCEVREIRCRGTEFIPHVCGSGTGGQHGARFVEQCAVEALNATILRGSVRCSEKMEYTFLSAPVLDLIGGEFAVVGDEALETMGSLVFKE